jgi:hypothetical protein
MAAYSVYSQLPSIFGGLLLSQPEDMLCHGDRGPIYLPNIIGMLKSRMNWEGHVVHMGDEKWVHKF